MLDRASPVGDEPPSRVRMGRRRRFRRPDWNRDDAVRYAGARRGPRPHRNGRFLGQATWMGAAMLLAYGPGHSVLLLVAGITPTYVQTLVGRLGRFERWLPGQRTFAGILVIAGLLIGIKWRSRAVERRLMQAFTIAGDVVS